jgi:hypothetical protein
LVYEFNFFRENNDLGYAAKDNSNIYFSQRNVINYTNSLTGKYTLNNVMNLNLSIRHYWSYTVNKQYYTLLDNGDLASNSTYTANKDKNYHTWNLDLSYSWWFAPGSQISILYRNNASIFESGTSFTKYYENNFKNLVNNDNLNHVFSISLRYFIDYNSLKKQ